MMVDLDRIVLGDKSLSAREIWGAEYQENVCVLIKKENIELLRKICERERIYFMVIGKVTSARILGASLVDSGKIEVFSNRAAGRRPARGPDLHQHPPARVHRHLPPVGHTSAGAAQHLLCSPTWSRALSTFSPSAASVSSVNKFDRSITGLIASQPRTSASPSDP